MAEAIVQQLTHYKPMLLGVRQSFDVGLSRNVEAESVAQTESLVLVANSGG